MMRPIFLAIPLLLSFLPGVAGASGFGWYVCSVEWMDFAETAQGLREEAADLLGESDKPKLRAYLQLQADSQIVDHCEGTSEGPSSAEFYSRDLAAYALGVQTSAGVENSYFRFFKDPPDFIAIEKRGSRHFIDPVYFVLSPEQVKGFHDEVVALNRREHPRTYRSLLKHLEAVLLKTMHDNWDWANTNDSIEKVGNDFGNGERGLIFYGHD